ncbi:MAG: hypothetical protein CMI60_22950 [Parvibaculum sp.]|nr:hypothetical protein [Parvibaculum sp.]
MCQVTVLNQLQPVILLVKRLNRLNMILGHFVLRYMPVVVKEIILQLLVIHSFQMDGLLNFEKVEPD